MPLHPLLRPLALLQQALRRAVGAVIGSGVQIAAGRAIPPGLTIVQDPADLVMRVDLPPGTSRARTSGGGLVPL